MKLTLTAQMVRDTLCFKGPMSFDDFLNLYEGIDVVDLNIVLTKAIANNQIESKDIVSEGKPVQIFYTMWRD